MSFFGKARLGRRPRCARPVVEALEDVCLMSTAPGLAHVAAQVARAQQQPMQQVRATLRAAGIPLCMQAKMCRATLLADYHKALGGTTWQVHYRRPIRHLGPYLVEIPPATPTTPTTPTTPASVTLAAPTLSLQSVATDHATISVKAGPGGAPFGVFVRLATLADYQAAGNQFPASGTIETTLHDAMTEGQTANLEYPTLQPGTQYVAQAVALPGSTTTPAPGTEYLQSPPGNVLAFATVARVQLDSPCINVNMVGLDTATAAIAAGETGAPFGILVRGAALADYVAAGGQFPAIGTVETTLPGPLAAGEVSELTLDGLYQGTEYVLQAVALPGSSATPPPGVEYLQSAPSVLTVFVTEHTTQAEPPTLALSNAGPHIVTLTLTAGEQGAPGGWVMEYTTYNDFLAHGWANAQETFNVAPMEPGDVQYPAIGGLNANTQYIFRAEAEGGGLILTSGWSNELVVRTLPTGPHEPTDC